MRRGYNDRVFDPNRAARSSAATAGGRLPDQAFDWCLPARARSASAGETVRSGPRCHHRRRWRFGLFAFGGGAMGAAGQPAALVLCSVWSGPTRWRSASCCWTWRCRGSDLTGWQRVYFRAVRQKAARQTTRWPGLARPAGRGVLAAHVTTPRTILLVVLNLAGIYFHRRAHRPALATYVIIIRGVAMLGANLGC